jgi:hypothetical protein
MRYRVAPFTGFHCMAMDLPLGKGEPVETVPVMVTGCVGDVE